jgi:hypothetical protein
VNEQPEADDGATTDPGHGVVAEIRDAVTLRAALLVVGVLLLQLGFILSYAGAFHSPSPHHIRLGVVAPAGAPRGSAGRLAEQLSGLPGEPLEASVVSGAGEAKNKIEHRSLDGALVVGRGHTDRLLVASAEGGTLSAALHQVVGGAETHRHRSIRTVDVVPAGHSDTRGLTPFYLAVGWVVGGYLVASILAISAGARPANATRAGVRLGALALYSVVSGIGGAVIVGPVLGALNGAFWTLAGFGMLVVFCIGAFTMAIESIAGIVGIGLAVLLFVVLGNPSAGGAYPGPLLPPFWRAIGPYIPTGAATEGVRGVVYFHNAGLEAPLLCAIAYAVAGTAVLLAVAAARGIRGDSAAAQHTRSAPA